MYNSPEATRKTRELWFRVALGAAEDVPRKVMANGCISFRVGHGWIVRGINLNQLRALNLLKSWAVLCLLRQDWTMRTYAGVTSPMDWSTCSSQMRPTREGLQLRGDNTSNGCRLYVACDLPPPMTAVICHELSRFFGL